MDQSALTKKLAKRYHRLISVCGDEISGVSKTLCKMGVSTHRFLGGGTWKRGDYRQAYFGQNFI